MFRILVLTCCIAVSCGFAVEPRLDGRIVGGVKAAITDIPYQASLQDKYGHICGAVIISNKWIATAAHCVGNQKYYVSVGSTHTTNGTSYDVKRVIKHENFRYSDFDIAVLELNKTLALSKAVRPVKLASVEPSPNSIVTTSGWGRLSSGGPSATHVQKVSVPIVEKRVCRQLYATVDEITDRMICAGVLGVGGKDSCNGDSGGPLVANGTLYGIVSWGVGCAQPQYPGVYTNVANLRSWIKKNSGV